MKIKLTFQSGKELVVNSPVESFNKWFSEEHTNHFTSYPSQFWSTGKNLAWDWNRVEFAEVIEQ